MRGELDGVAGDRAAAEVYPALGDGVLDAALIEAVLELDTDPERPVLARLMGIFAEQVAEALPRMHGALDHEEWGELQDLAHRLRRGCAYVGATGLSHLLRELESRASEAAPDELWARLVAIEHESDLVVLALQAFLEVAGPNPPSTVRTEGVRSGAAARNQ